jgi:uncharacterized protein (TIGR03437 family)
VKVALPAVRPSVRTHMRTFKLELIAALALAAAPLGRAQSTVTFNTTPTRIFGQPVLQTTALTAIAPNLVEGREFSSPEAVAVDTSANPPILYVADTGNNRVLAWKNINSFTNGSFADMVIGQPEFLTKPFLSTTAKGPGTSMTTGLSAPSALVVDKNGNLYVADAGNNRIVRYPAPFQQTTAILNIDLIIGQPNITSGSANQGQKTPTASTIALVSGGGALTSGLAFDSSGNLWVSDSGNNRVLSFPAASLAPNTVSPAATAVLGQVNFTTGTVAANTNQQTKSSLVFPAGLGFDSSNDLFVADELNRVLVFTNLLTAAPALRIMGVIPATQQNPNPPTISAGTLGALSASNQPTPPNSVFFVGNNPWVLDTGNNRVLQYQPFSQWPPEATSFSPVATAVFGQNDFVSNKANEGLAQPTAATLSSPTTAVFVGNDLYLTDSGNNRVLDFPLQSGSTFLSATRVLGQTDFKYNSENLIEGRELFLFAGTLSGNIALGGGAAVIDANSTPPHLYVSDPLNNRVLGFKDYRTVNAGATADLVIGEPDLFTGIVNYPTNSATQLNNQGLSFPEGLAVDGKGNLYVADTGNARVLRFPTPFNPAQNEPQANLVLGQVNFNTKVTDPSAQNMAAPYGLAFTSAGHLLVSDQALDRVLLFLKPSGGDFTNGQFAANVIGQPNFGAPSQAVLNQPHLITVDPDDRLYVADSVNSRIVLYSNVPTAGNNPQISFSITTGASATDSLRNPEGVYCDPATADIWVSDTYNQRILRYPRFDQLFNNPIANTTLAVNLPLALTLDPFSNPIVLEGTTNRVSFFSPAIDYTSAAGGVSGRFSGSAANYFSRFAPGMISAIFPFAGQQFGSQTATGNVIPLPTTLGDVQVVVNGKASPLFYVSPSQINFQVPYETPTGSQQQFNVVQASTGQILASGLFEVDPVAPGLFTSDGTGAGELAAINAADNTVNSPGNPAKAGTYITLFGTGIGAVPGAPADGMPPNGLIYSGGNVQVFMNTGQVPTNLVQFSGLAPNFVGVWQINAQIPSDAIGTVPVAVVLNGVSTNVDQFGNRRILTIQVKQ